MRVWFSGPRMFGGLVRPGISLGPEDFRRSIASPSEMPRWFVVLERIGLIGAAVALTTLGIVAAFALAVFLYVVVTG